MPNKSLSAQSQDPTAFSRESLLAKFVRYSIAPRPALAERLDRRNMREFLRYEALANINGMRIGDYRAWKKRRTDFYDLSVSRVEGDISRYRHWSPTQDDWIKLHVSESDAIPFTYRKRAYRPKAEAEHLRDRLVREYCAVIDDETGLKHTVAAAARKAAHRLNRLMDACEVPAGFGAQAVTIEKEFHRRKRERRRRQEAAGVKLAESYRAKAARFREFAVDASPSRAEALRVAADKWEQDAQTIDCERLYVPDRDDLPPSLQDLLDLSAALKEFEVQFSSAVEECRALSNQSAAAR